MEPTEQQVPPAEQAPPAAEPDRFAALEAKLTSMQEALNEQGNVAKFWYEKATASTKEVAPKETATDDEDILEIMAKGGKAFEDMMTKRGYVKADDVDKKVNSRAAQLAKEAQLVKQYPDLEDPKSEFFVAVSAEYGALIKLGVSQSVAMEMAAERWISVGCEKARPKPRLKRRSRPTSPTAGHWNAENGAVVCPALKVVP